MEIVSVLIEAGIFDSNSFFDEPVYASLTFEVQPHPLKILFG
jgi:hypothetical protein